MNPSKTGLNVILIRHAESSNNVLNDIYIDEEYDAIRQPDPDLSDHGRLQATYLGRHLAANPRLYNISNSNNNSVYCSAMHRALKTADFIGKEIGVSCEVWPDIFEIEGCHKKSVPFTGKSKSEIQTLFPNTKLPPECTEEGWFLLDRIETHEEAWERAGRVIQKLHLMASEDIYKGKTVAIVSHGLFLDYLLGRLVGRDMRGSPKFSYSNTGVSFVVLHENKCKIKCINSVTHLYRVEDSSNDL